MDTSMLNRAKALRPYIEKAATALSDDDSIKALEMFPKWKADAGSYKKGDRLTYNGTLYKVLQDHTPQESWTPEAAPSLFATVLDSINGTPTNWVQPDSTNGYANGSKVIHGGKTWTSTADNNVWEPGATGAPWTQDTSESEGGESTGNSETIPEFIQPTGSTDAYAKGARVTYNGFIYESLIDNNAYSPDAYPAGWKKVTT